MYKATQENGTAILSNETGLTTAKILTGIGNTLCSFSSQNEELIYFPETPEVYNAHNKLSGIPLLHPWANRIEGEHFWWREHRYEIPANLIPMRDNNYLPMHGLLYKTPHWETTRLEANNVFAVHEAHLDFASFANYMTVFPFAHELTMRHWLEGNTLTVSLDILNTGNHEMPVCSGFHPYFSYHNYERADVYLSIPVTEKWVTNPLLLPTGEKKSPDQFVPGKLFSLQDLSFDDGFTGRIADQPFILKTPGYTATIMFGNNYPNAVIYAPTNPDKPYVCIEPMAAPTNALQLEHYNLTKVSSVAPEKKWSAWFSIQLEVS